MRDRVLEASEYIPIEQLGTADDCGFSPFNDDILLAVILPSPGYARVLGTKLAENPIRR
jgi:5-methyltetrahydropteroyltriglutamate--homocysteine methyltransferase